jgi:hypothetical protein
MWKDEYFEKKIEIKRTSILNGESIWTISSNRMWCLLGIQCNMVDVIMVLV